MINSKARTIQENNEILNRILDGQLSVTEVIQLAKDIARVEATLDARIAEVKQALACQKSISKLTTLFYLVSFIATVSLALNVYLLW